MLAKSQLQYNLNLCLAKLKACPTVTLVAVSKGQPIESIQDLYEISDHTVTNFAENYLNEAESKISALAEYPLDWHFIGKLQTNKLKIISSSFSWVQTVTRPIEASKLAKYRPAALSPLNILVQIKLDNDQARAGINILDKNSIEQLFTQIEQYPNLNLRGIMAILPNTKDIEQTRIYFQKLNTLFKNLQAKFPEAKLDTLSMGMSNDYVIAIENGATMVRIGTKLFGERNL